MSIVYLDNAATTKMRPEVMEYMVQTMQHVYANASATYSIGRKTKAALESSRKRMAHLLGISSTEIIYTSGGTEANNMVLNSAVRDMGIKRIITSKIEHHAVLKTIETLVKQNDITIDYVDFTTDGDISLESLEKLLQANSNKTLVSLMHINNEIGTILDISEVGSLCHTYGAYFHTDTVQSVGHYPINFKESKVHFATASAHKFHGPKGIGFAYIAKNIGFRPSQLGGEQERGLRAGTEAVPLILAMDKAIEISYAKLVQEKTHISNIKKYTIEQLELLLPEINFNAKSNEVHRNYNLLNLRLPISSEKASTILFKLDMEGICCSRGSACQSGSNKPSHVLAAILPMVQLQYTSLRFSFSIYTTHEEIDLLIRTLKRIL